MYTFIASASCFFFSSRRRHTRSTRDWSSDVCSSDLIFPPVIIRVRTESGWREETHVDGGVTLPFFIAPAPEDLPQFAGAGAQPTVVRVIIDGRLRDFPRAAKANALSIFRRSVSAGLSRMTRTTLEQTMAATRGGGVYLD